MRQSLVRLTVAAALLPLAASGVAQSSNPAHNRTADAAVHDAIAKAVADPRRKPDNVARDRYRHPLETLRFFDVKPSDTVVEIWPGGGWYTEILAPYVAAGGGRLVAAQADWGREGFQKMKDADPRFQAVDLKEFPAFEPGSQRVLDNSADVVLTFRNVHNWRMGYRRPDKQDYSAEAFRQIYAMLKPGGTFGIVDHRLPEGASADREMNSGYIKTSTIRRLAEQAGFRFVAESDVNANPRDTADWPDGVWTLPPSYRLKDVDRAKYAAIGESDRMTLKFIKPR